MILEKVLEDSFKHSFGVSSTLNETPQEIILSFTPRQGKIRQIFATSSFSRNFKEDEREYIKIKAFPNF